MVKHKFDVLREHCETENRPYTDIEKTTLDSLLVSRDGRDGTMSPQQAIDNFAEQAEMGVDVAIFSLRNVSDPSAFDVFRDEIVPQVSKIPVAGR